MTEPQRELLYEVRRLREELFQSSRSFQASADDLSGLALDADEITKIAYVASLMAANYAYTLAALLKVAEEEFGPDAAERLAGKADAIMSDGDENSYNEDLEAAFEAAQTQLAKPADVVPPT